MRKKYLGKLACCLLTAVSVVGALTVKSVIVSNAASTTLGAPYNYVDLKTVDSEGNNLKNTSYSLTDSTGNQLVKWSSGNELYANYAKHIFTSDEAIETVTVPAGTYAFYSNVPAGFAKDNTVALTDHDSNGEAVSTTNINIDSYYNKFGYQSVSYPDFHVMLSGSGNTGDFYNVISTDKQYYKVKIHLNDYWPNTFDDNGVIEHKVKGNPYKLTPNTTYNTSDGGYIKCYLLIVSDQVANFVTPDSNGDVEIYVAANGSHLGYCTDYDYALTGSYGGGGGTVGSPDSTATNHKEDVTDSGNSTSGLLSMKNLKAGTYTVTATNSRLNATDTQQFTVSESTNVQTFTLSFFASEEETSTETETSTEAEPSTETETSTEAEPSTEIETTTGEVAADEELVTTENATASVKAGEVAADEATSSNVKTSDRAHTALYIELLLVAFACITTVVVFNQVKSKKNSDN